MTAAPVAGTRGLARPRRRDLRLNPTLVGGMEIADHNLHNSKRSSQGNAQSMAL
jgi:hypothetical protein